MTRLLHMICLLLVPVVAGCPSGWDDDTVPQEDDDDVFDDDDDTTVADDDDTGSPKTPEYPEEEEFFTLAVGNVWRYAETVSADVVPVEDDVWVEVVARWWGPDLDPPRGDDFVAFEIDVDRLYGEDVTYWYGLDGSGALKWLGTRFWSDFLEYEDVEGDETVVLTSGHGEAALIGEEYEGALFLTDRDDFDFSTEASTLETFMYGEGEEVETLGLLVYEHESPIGLQYFEAGWGILGMEIEVGGASTVWTITQCSACPPEANL